MFNEDKEKKHRGMENFGEELKDGVEKTKEDEPDHDITIPDDVFQEMSIMYFNEVYTRHTKQLKELTDQIAELRKEIEELKKDK